MALWRTYEDASRPELEGVDAVVSLGGTAHPDQDGAEPWLAAELDLLEEALDLPEIQVSHSGVDLRITAVLREW